MSLNGVRATASAYLKGDDEKNAPPSLRELFHLISDPNNLDTTVVEVFGAMLGINCQRSSEDEITEVEPVTAVVGFGGLLSGACVLRVRGDVARKIAADMTGMELAEIDATVKDGIGEICNMLAGAWKAKIPELAIHCGLSIPAVITGKDYALHVQAPEFQLHHYYCSEGSNFSVTIHCDSLR